MATNIHYATFGGTGLWICPKCGQYVETLYQPRHKRELEFVCAACYSKTHASTPSIPSSSIISDEPLTPSETAHLYQLAWKHGTDDDRERMRRAGIDFGEVK